MSLALMGFSGGRERPEDTQVVLDVALLGCTAGALWLVVSVFCGRGGT